jgi:hypothetical protein
MTSIRAYGMSDAFKNINSSRLNYNTTELLALRYCSCWFGLRLDILGALLVAVTLLSIVLTRIISPESLDPGFAGIALSNYLFPVAMVTLTHLTAYISGITLLLSQLNLNAVETETRVNNSFTVFIDLFCLQLNSVERIKEYDSLPQELDDIIPNNR